MYSEKDGLVFIEYVKNVIKEHLFGVSVLPDVSSYVEKQGVFVTLKKKGELRGCIGFPYPVYMLKDSLHEAAIAAAFSDPRFPKVVKEEFDFLEFEITVLSVPSKYECSKEKLVSSINVGVDGLIVQRGSMSGLLLPQVAVEWKMSSKKFLESTCQKAGLSLDAWKDEDVDVYHFEGQIFKS